ncbi:APC family permease [Microbacterium sp. Root553]|uniref:APC family permease n=1 Tax=Microbacterium sp. Root553 TaxID=1736556 RepID=UPI0006FF6C55|nr:APC family permease [Microbacterium sp. Root553]KQZ24240.1 amino acid transporter [Microbacterium sp. Root553]
MTQQTSLRNEEHTGQLKKAALSAWGVVFLVISAAAPLSVLAGIGPLAVLIGGVSAPIVYAVAGIVLAVFAVGFLFMARNLTAMGGFYTYIAVGLGRVVGLAAGFLAWISYNLLQIGLWGLFGVMAQGMFATVFGIDVPWWLLAVIGAVLVFALAVAGVDVGAKVLGVLLVLETILLVVLASSILTQRAGQLEFGTFAPENIFTPSMFAILGFGFAAFMGFESTVLYRSETRDPDRSIPRATYIAVAFLAVFYTVTLWLVIQAFGDGEVQGVIAQDPAAFFFTAMGAYVGDWGVSVMFVLIVTSIFAGQLAFHNAINRYSFALARDGILPAAFTRTNRMGAPWIAGVIQSVVAVIVVIAFGTAGLDPLTQLVILVNSPGVYGIITLQLLASIAVLIFIIRNRHLARRWYVLPAAIVSLVAMAVLLVVLVITIDYLTSAGPAINAIILAVVPVVLLLGAAYALVLRARRPEVFARIGGADPETARVENGEAR